MDRRLVGFAAIVLGNALPLTRAASQTKQYPLESATGLRVHNTLARAVVHEGRKGVEIVVDTDALSRDPDATRPPGASLTASIVGAQFSNGTISIEVAGAPAPAADTSIRGFVGIAFRVQENQTTYDAFYLRPTNGRAEDQERRNHATQYISHPDWPWFRLRRETPSRYESYVDLVPGAWTKIRIEVHGTEARLFVRDEAQPVLVVHDLKTGPNGSGGVALWIGPGSIGYFRNLVLTGSR